MPACRRAYTKAEVSHLLRYFLEFLPHPAQDRMSPHPTYHMMTLTFTIAPASQNALTWRLTILHNCSHCISSTPNSNQNTHHVQRPQKQLYTCVQSFPVQTFRHSKRHSGVPQFFPLSFSRTSSLSVYLWSNNGYYQNSN